MEGADDEELIEAGLEQIMQLEGQEVIRAFQSAFGSSDAIFAFFWLSSEPDWAGSKRPI